MDKSEGSNPWELGHSCAMVASEGLGCRVEKEGAIMVNLYRRFDWI